MAKQRKKTARKPRTRKQNLTGVSLSDLQAEVSRRASQVDALVAERDELFERVEELDEQIRMLSSIAGSSAPGSRGRSAKRGRPAGSGKRKASGRKTTGRKRPKNDASLAEAMAKMLKGKTMGVTEIATNVQKAGYKTNSENFRTIVNQTLIKDARFKKISRGQYTAA